MVGSKASIQVVWKVNSYDYSIEKAKNIAHKFSEKYGIPIENVKVIPELIAMDANGKEVSLTSDVITNIQDPAFQQKLFKEYLDINKVENYDFDEILRIDADINSKISYDTYDKYRRYSINWMKMSNFLSYGKENFFDFNSLKGLVLLNGEPANQSGKTTFAIDAIRFALFGKTTRPYTLEQIFNRHLPKETEAEVECSIKIDGEDYIIKRTITRPALGKRTAKSKVSQTVKYYKVVGDSLSELSDIEENLSSENSQQTNKVIKDAIGREEDFDLIISVTGKTLDDLIDKKETERGRLLSRWIGLLPIEEKDVIAREKFNQTIKPNLLSNRYNTEKLNDEISAYKTQIEVLKEENAKYNTEIASLDETIMKDEATKNTLLLAKQNVSAELMSIDITTLNATIERIKGRGIAINNEMASLDEEYESIKDVTFNINEYDAIVGEVNQISTSNAVLNNQYNTNGRMIEQLEKSEYCPTCGRKYENIDNSSKINELRVANEGIITQINTNNAILSQKNSVIEQMKCDREKYDRKSRIDVRRGALNVEREQLRNEYLTHTNTLKEYQKNNEAIDKNNQIDMQLRNIEFAISGHRSHRETNVRAITTNESTIRTYTEQIDARNKMIEDLAKEAVTVRNWKIYLDLVGKNGISKMVLRNTLPIINAKLADLMSDVCDFDLEVSMTDKNEVVFNMIRDGIASDIRGGSGYEMTVSAMALRAVLAHVSTIPRCNCLVLDELWGRVAKENLDRIKDFLLKIMKDYDFIIQVSHLDEVKDWNNTIITVKKTGNVSSLIRVNLC